MKRKTAIILLMALISALLPQVAFSTSTAEKVLINDDFESTNTWKGDGYIYSWVNEAQRVDMGGKHKNVVKFAQDASGINWLNCFGKSFDKVYTDGKLLISFDTYIEAYSRFGDPAADNRSYMFLYVYPETASSWDDINNQKTTKKTPFAVDYKGGLGSLGLGALDMTAYTNGVGTQVKADLKKWYHVDILLEFGGKVKTYLDGVQLSTLDTPSDLSIGAISFSGQLNGPGTDFRIDNLKAVHNPSSLQVNSVDVNETEKYIDLTFNNTLKSEQGLNPDNVKLKKCGSIRAEVSVTSVTMPYTDTLRVSYTGEFESGREYKLICENSILDAFGNTLALEVPFNAESKPLNKKQQNIDFEGLNANALPGGFSESTGWSGAEISYTAHDDGQAVKLTKSNVSAGTHLYFINDISSINNKKGKLTYSLDMYLDSKNTAPNMRAMINGGFYLFTKSDSTGALTYDNKTQIGTLKKDDWNNLKFVFDYAAKEIKYYANEAHIKTISFDEVVPYSGTTKFDGNFTRLDFITYIAATQTSSLYFDNINASYEEIVPTVSKVRYFDADGNEFLGDQLEENSVSKIKVGFNTKMNASTVNQNTVTLKNSKGAISNTTGKFDENENSYTIVLNSGELETNPYYTLTVSKDASSLAGISMTQDVTYSFAVGTSGITEIYGYENQYTVAYGSKFSELPKTVMGVYDGGEVEMEVRWSEDGYLSKTPGTYTVRGEIIPPSGYEYSGFITTTVTVSPDTSAVELAQNITSRKSIGPTLPLSTGALSSTDTLQLGVATGAISIVSDEFTNASAIADSENAQKTGSSAKTTGDGEIEIVFNESYDGSNTLQDMKLMFNKTSDNLARWNLELLYKNSDGEWVVFYKDNTDFKSSSYENGYYSSWNFTNAIYPTLILKNLDELTDVNGIKIRFLGLRGGYELLEADINMASDGNTINAKRREIINPINFSNMYSDGAVIQRDKEITVWGYGGDAGDEIEVLIKDKNGSVVRQKTAVSDGRVWEVTINEGISGSLDAYQITATDKSDAENTKTVSDILFGDVFIASGQSNMGYTLGNLCNRLNALGTEEAISYRKEIVDQANENLDGLRFFYQPGFSSIYELEDAYAGKWYKNGGFHSGVHSASAVAYFFAYDLYKNKLNEEIPVAFVTAALGGSGVRAWLTEEAYEELFPELTDFNRAHYSVGGIYTGCYNALLAPLEKNNYRGVIWYQGEGDHSQYADYDKWFEAMHKAWMKRFNDDKLSFTTVQLAGWDGGSSSRYFPEIRQTQMQIWQKNEGLVNMITALDVGENDGTLSNSNDIHPLYKTPVGKRISAAVANNIYGMDIEYSGPLFESVKKLGSGLELSFTHADGLNTKTRTAPYKEEYAADTKINCLEISTDGITWVEAQNASISGNKIIITCDEAYTYVRYAWSDYPENPNLYNSENFPAFPFTASVSNDRVMNVRSNNASVTVTLPLTDKLKLSGKLFVAKYDKENGRMKALEMTDANFVLNDENSYTFNMGVNENETVKAMLVDSISNLTPLLN